jgi:nitroreductase
MDVIEALRTTGSVRGFSDEVVTDAHIEYILEAARFAPSGGNKQGWRVIVLKNPERRQAVVNMAINGWKEYQGITKAGTRPFATDVTGVWPGIPEGIDLNELRNSLAPNPMLDEMSDGPALLVVCADLQVIAAVDVDGHRTPIAGGASVYPFTWSMLLAARSLGLGGVLTTYLIRDQEAARPLLGIPDGYAIAALIVIGHPTHQNTKLTRKAVQEFATIDSFDGPALGG